MTSPATVQRKRVLDANERLTEILFALIMVLTFTSSITAATAGREEVRSVLIGAIGCNVAWGLIDAFMYLMAILMERGQHLRIARAVRASKDDARGRSLIAAALPDPLPELFDEDAFERAREKVLALADVSAEPRLHGRDYLGALAVFLIVFLSAFPLIVPFMIFSPLQLASRVSDGIAIVMLYGVGHSFGKHAGLPPVRVGLAMVAIGAVLIAVTIALGG